MFDHSGSLPLKCLNLPELSRTLTSRPSCLMFGSATPPFFLPPSAPLHLGCSWKTPPSSFVYWLFFELNLPIKTREILWGRPASVGSILPAASALTYPPSTHTQTQTHKRTLLSPQDSIIRMQSTREETLPSCSWSSQTHHRLFLCNCLSRELTLFITHSPLPLLEGKPDFWFFI